MNPCDVHEGTFENPPPKDGKITGSIMAMHAVTDLKSNHL